LFGDRRGGGVRTLNEGLLRHRRKKRDEGGKSGLAGTALTRKEPKDRNTRGTSFPGKGVMTVFSPPVVEEHREKDDEKDEEKEKGHHLKREITA